MCFPAACQANEWKDSTTRLLAFKALSFLLINSRPAEYIASLGRCDALHCCWQRPDHQSPPATHASMLILGRSGLIMQAPHMSSTQPRPHTTHLPPSPPPPALHIRLSALSPRALQQRPKAA